MGAGFPDGVVLDIVGIGKHRRDIPGIVTLENRIGAGAGQRTSGDGLHVLELNIHSDLGADELLGDLFVVSSGPTPEEE